MIPVRASCMGEHMQREVRSRNLTQQRLANGLRVIAATSAKMRVDIALLVRSVPKSLFMVETGEISLHSVSVLAVRIVLRFYLRHLELQATRVKVESRAITPAYVQRDVFRSEALHHRPGRLVHQLLSDAQSPVRAFHSQTGDMPVRIVLTILLHLGEYISYYSALLVLRHITQLRPGESVIQIVLHLIILG